MENTRTKKTIIVAIGLAIVFIASAAIVVLTMIAVKDKDEDDNTALVTTGAATLLVDQLATTALADETLATIATSAPDHQTQTAVVTVSDDTLYKVAASHSLSFSSQGPLNANERTAIETSLDAFFEEKQLTKTESESIAAFAIYTGTDAVCSASGANGSPEIEVSCQDLGVANDAVKRTKDMISTSAFDASAAALVTLSAASDEDERHTVSIITISDDQNIQKGALLFTQNAANQPSYIGNMAERSANNGGGKVNSSEATTAVMNDEAFGPLLKTLLGTEQ